MQSEAKKVIFTDNGRDIALTGEVVSEDDFFVTIISRGREYKVGKKAIVAIESLRSDNG